MPMGSSGMSWDYDVDVVVAGSGNGGMSAAIAAAEGGARTLLVEIDSVTGGSSAMSGGGIAIGGATSYEDYLQLTHGMHDAPFSKAYFDGFLKYAAWLKQIGAAVSPCAPPALNLWIGSNPEAASEPQCREYFNSLETIFRSFSGELLLSLTVS